MHTIITSPCAWFSIVTAIISHKLNSGMLNNTFSAIIRPRLFIVSVQPKLVWRRSFQLIYRILITSPTGLKAANTRVTIESQAGT